MLSTLQSTDRTASTSIVWAGDQGRQSFLVSIPLTAPAVMSVKFSLGMPGRLHAKDSVHPFPGYTEANLQLSNCNIIKFCP